MVKTVSVSVYGKLHGTLHKCLAKKKRAHTCARARHALRTPTYQSRSVRVTINRRYETSVLVCLCSSAVVSVIHSIAAFFHLHFIFASADCAQIHIQRMKYQMENIASFRAMHKWR